MYYLIYRTVNKIDSFPFTVKKIRKLFSSVNMENELLCLRSTVPKGDCCFEGKMASYAEYIIT